MTKTMYNIIEIANTHGGNKDYMLGLIDEFSKYEEGFGIKFQPSKPDCIALPDYEFYEVYKDFFYTEEEWNQFISLAYETKDVWLDLFDTYSIKILQNNFEKIRGVKLQASVLNNFEVIDALEETGLESKDLIINISGYDISTVEAFIEMFEQRLKPHELMLEVGFQAYPTKLEDSGYSKLKRIKNKFSHRIVFADHIDANNPMSIYFPVMVGMDSADIIEKHVRLDRKTEYDHFSSLTPKNFAKFIEIQQQCVSLEAQPFINNREREYLSKSLMKPILSQQKEQGSLISLKEDLSFRRSGKDGLNIFQIENKINSFHVVSRDVKKESTLTQHDFKSAHIATIVACRLKSTRLKKKALKKIGDLASIEYCIRNCMRFPNVQSTVLATSNLEDDAPLKDYLYNENVHFYQGHPVDVIDRYLEVINDLKIDVFVRVTGDNPFVDAGVCEILLREHFKKGADYTTATTTAVGANLEIISSEALKTVKKYFPAADYSEYMGSYFTNNPDYFNIEFVDLPQKYIRDYRLTLDYPEDIKLYNIIHEKLSKKNPDFDLLDIYQLLDETNLSEINSSHSQRYTNDQELMDKLKKNTTIE